MHGDDREMTAMRLQHKLLDLKFLITLEQDGYAGSLLYYKHAHLFTDQGPTARSAAAGEQARINEIKLLIQHIYAFFGTKKTTM